MGTDIVNSLAGIFSAPKLSKWLEWTWQSISSYLFLYFSTNQIKGNVKQKYGEWFDDNKTLAEGKIDEVIGKIQEKSGKTREEVEKMIKDWKI